MCRKIVQSAYWTLVPFQNCVWAYEKLGPRIATTRFFFSRLDDSWCFGAVATHHFLGESFETRVAAQGVEPPVDLDAAEDAGVEGGAIFIALFQQSHRFLLIAQRQLNDGKRIGRDIALPRFSRQVVEYLVRLRLPSRQGIGPGERGLNSRVGIELRGFLILNDRFR